ncbi:ABC transporter substrate-binding protein [Demequina capsici]|uniref:ABC transporter substrate-binding protein n=1 Tax=Demequina capsici TaxID=3075620 RepID=A0AA96FCR1_9MICO|nr:ABC transporter substrate-binding protein [Demequina sp. PMTSA13]WNM28476.1 ABC transporter substrate-binding protein [Demequina sp. PMTSA13]
MKISPRLALGSIAVAVLGLTAACSSTPSASESSGSATPDTSTSTTQAMETVSINLGLVQGQDFIHAMPARVAEEKGFFTDAGLDVTVIDFTSGSDLTKAIAGGTVDVGAATGLDAVAAAAHDVDIQAFWGIYGPSPMALIVGADSTITGFADTAGTKIGISRVGSLTDYTLRAALDASGVSIDDVTEVPLGDPATTMAALANGDVDGFVLPVTFAYIVQAQGTGKLAEVAGDVIGGPDQFAILMAPSTYIADNTDTLKRLTDVYTQTIEWMQANPDETVAIAMDKLGMSDSIAQGTYDQLMSNFTTDGSIDVDGLAAYASALPSLGIADTSPDQSAYFNDALQG